MEHRVSGAGLIARGRPGAGETLPDLLVAALWFVRRQGYSPEEAQDSTQGFSSGCSNKETVVGSGTLTVGTVFIVIDNTSNLPISGRFRNLSNGLVLTSNDGTKFKVNYTGGTGNDLTLKVVP